MKKILLTLASCFLILGFTICMFAEENLTKFDFRQVHWGVTKEEVKNIEKEKLSIELNDSLVYNTTINYKECVLIYTFFNNGVLDSGGYMFDIEHTNKNDYIEDYKNIQRLLIQKYQQPQIDKINWKRDLFKSDLEKWGLAVSIGDLNFRSQWIIENTTITLTLRGDNFKTSLMLLYEDKNFDFHKNNKNTEGL